MKPIMKKYIALLTIAAFAVAAQAADKTCPAKDKAACCMGKDKATCAEKAKAGCADQAKAGGCCAKSAAARKVLQSPKAAGEAGR